MCGFSEWPDWADELTLDKLSRTSQYWAMRTKHQEMGADEVFRLRTKMNMTQRQFGDAVGVDPITVSRWERAVTKVSTAYAVLIRKTLDEIRSDARQERAAR